jgi:hypothetical protein
VNGLPDICDADDHNRVDGIAVVATGVVHVKHCHDNVMDAVPMINIQV